jgi:hypothetical protein
MMMKNAPYKKQSFCLKNDLFCFVRMQGVRGLADWMYK